MDGFRILNNIENDGYIFILVFGVAYVNHGEGTEIWIFVSVRLSVLTHCILQPVLTTTS
jgi:hypothetical protein